MAALGRILTGPRTSKVGFAQHQRQGRGDRSKPLSAKRSSAERCLVPVDSFYEWRQDRDREQPYALALADRAIMALAGLWRTGVRRPASGAQLRGHHHHADELCAESIPHPVILEPGHGRPGWASSRRRADLKALLAPTLRGYDRTGR